MIMCYYHDVSDEKLKIWKNGGKLGKVLPKKKKKITSRALRTRELKRNICDENEMLQSWG